MHQILVYADSLSWGIIPDTRSRFRFDQRWPGIVELELQKAKGKMAPKFQGAETKAVGLASAI